MRTNAEGLSLIAAFIDEYDAAESRTAAEGAVNLYVKARLNSNQFSALVCLVMNIGRGEFKRSQLLKTINASVKDRDLLLKAADQFDRYIYETNDFGERVLDPFLIKQREYEKALFLLPAILPKRRRK
jgi:lysozyme